MRMIANIRLLLPIIVIAVLTAACASKANQPHDAVALSAEQAQSGTESVTPSGIRSGTQSGAQSDTKSEKPNEAANTVSDSNPGPAQRELIAEIPERDIALFGASDGVVLRIGEHERAFDWIYGTPRMIMPTMHAADFDADDEDELAVVLYVGSGTGVSVQELHIVEFDAAGRMEDHKFAPSDYIAQLDGELGFRPPGEKESASGEITAGTQTYRVNLGEYASGEYGELADRLAYGSIVRFEAEQSALRAEFAVGITLESFVMPEYIGTVSADVAFHEGRFHLKNLTFEPGEEFREH